MSSSPNFATLTIQDIADSLGVKVQSSEQIAFIERDADNFIKQILRHAFSLCVSSRSIKMCSWHISQALESRGLSPLLGYDNPPIYSNSPVSVDQSDIFGAVEDVKGLGPISCGEVASAPENEAFNLRWTLVEGAFMDNNPLYKAQKPPREMKPIERSVSVPNVASFQQQNQQQQMQSEQIVQQSVEPKYESKKTADDMLSNEHQKYFISIINLLRCDTVNSLDVALALVAAEDKLHQLIPYFLQYVMGRMTMELHDYGHMLVIIRFVLALLENKSLNIPLYAHPFMRIVFTALVAESLSNQVFPDDSLVRRYAAKALGILVNKCEDGFNGIRDVVFNSLIRTLFNPNATLWAQFGAILGIKEINYVDRLLPHFKSYIRQIRYELRSDITIQSQATEALFQLSKEVLWEFSKGCPINELKEMALATISEIDSISY